MTHLPDLDLALLFEASPAPLVAIDDELRVRAVSDSFLRWRGIDRAALIGRHYSEALPDDVAPESLDTAAAWLQRMSSDASGGPTFVELRTLAPGRTALRLHGSAARGACGRVRLFVLHAEQVDMAQSADVLALEFQRADLLRSNADLEQFAYVASHDMQEPLRMIANYLQLLQRRYAHLYDERAREYMGFVTTAAERIRAMIMGILEFARVGGSKPVLDLVESSACLEEAEHNLHSKIDSTAARIERGPLPRVLADRIHLIRIFQNLVSNALKFRSERPPHIRIEAVSLGEEWRFSVADNGIGIRPEGYPRLFLLFGRAEGYLYPGFGIGLATCKRLVEYHHGRIWFESRKGHGSTFFFTLPKAAVNDPSCSTSSQQTSPSTGPDDVHAAHGGDH